MLNLKNKSLVSLFACLLISSSLSAVEKAEAGKGLEKKTEKVSVQADRKLAVELERLIEARESVEKVFIQVNKPALDNTAKITATVLLQPSEGGALSDEELKKIKILISASIEGLDENQISLTYIDFKALGKKLNFKKKDREKAFFKNKKGAKDKKNNKISVEEGSEEIVETDEGEEADVHSAIEDNDESKVDEKAKKNEKKQDKKKNKGKKNE